MIDVYSVCMYNYCIIHMNAWVLANMQTNECLPCIFSQILLGSYGLKNWTDHTENLEVCSLYFRLCGYAYILASWHSWCLCVSSLHGIATSHGNLSSPECGCGGSSHPEGQTCVKDTCSRKGQYTPVGSRLVMYPHKLPRLRVHAYHIFVYKSQVYNI